MMRKRNNMRHGGGGGHRDGGGRSGGGHRSGGRYQGGGHRGGSGNNNEQNLGRQKHHAIQMREKYVNMAREAQMHSDRVDVEYYLQHVDHYTRVLADIAAVEAERYANYREQNPEHATNGHTENGAPADTNTDNGNNGGGAPMDDNFAPGNQPRMTRHRNHSNPAPQQTAHDANTGSSGDIPLPGSALPAI
jgi:hypothetical protein